MTDSTSIPRENGPESISAATTDADQSGKPRSRLRRLLRWTLRIIIYPLIILSVLVACQNRLIYPRHITEPAPEMADQVDGLEKLVIQTDSGEVEAWLSLGRGVTPERPGPLVIFAHGNAELIDYNTDLMLRYRDRGISVLMPEYRGYGRSAGSPSEKRIVEDFVRFYDLMIERAEIDKKRIIFQGRSIGGGVVCSLADHRRPQAMILQSTFTSLPDMAWHVMYIPSFLLRDKYENLRWIEQYSGPVIIFHGQQDEIIPYMMAERLAGAAERARLVPFVSGHNDLPVNSTTYWQALDAFLDENDLAPLLDGSRARY